MKQSLVLLCSAVLFGLTQGAAAATTITTAGEPVAHRQLEKIMQDYYEFNARFNPVAATFFGDNRYDDQIGMSIAPKNSARLYAQYHLFSKRLQQIDVAQLSEMDRTNDEILSAELASALSLETFPDYLLPLNQMDSMPVNIANLASGESAQVITTPKQYRAFLNRVKQLPGWMKQAAANMRVGINTGVVLPQALTTSLLPQYQKLITDHPEDSIYYSPIRHFPATFSAQEKRRLTHDYHEVIAQQLTPALKKFSTFLQNEYLPASRSTTGWGALPHGEGWYRAYVAAQTTTNMTPEQIHAIGLQEVARIQQQFAQLGEKLGYTGAPAGLPAWVREQPQFYPFKSEQEILAAYEKLNASLDSKLPALFTLIPKAKLEVHPEPELTRATASAHYSPPSADGSRPGIFWAVINDPTKYNSAGITTLFLHEGRPGHHFQLALQQELPLPKFRRFGGNNAYIEGWALYAESLGKELGLYEDPLQAFGNLQLELLRSVRLVVDTGMHAKGWTREQSIKYMQDTLGFTPAEAKNATERYMAWPGQALGYKIGAMKIAELRHRAELALGDKFSLPEFHAVVIGEGSMPLSTLEAKVDQMIAAKK